MKFLTELNETRTIAHYDAEAMNNDGGHDVYDRAISMINAAVEELERADNFEAIADVDSLVDYLKGRYHDFNQSIEQNVRDIIADETDSGDGTDSDRAERMSYDPHNEFGGESEEQEERRLTHFANGNRRPERKKDQEENYYGSRTQDNKKYQGALKSAARIISKVKPEEEESFPERVNRYKDETAKVLDDSRKRKMARKMALSGPSRRGRRKIGRGTGRPLGTFGLEQEETKDDWNEEVRKFRERNKKAEPGGSRRSDRLRRRRRSSTSDTGSFNLRFESFKTFLADETKDA